MALHFTPEPGRVPSTEKAGVGRLQLDIETTDVPLLFVRELLEFWEERARDGILRREAILPEEIVPLLPYVFLAEPEGTDWRYLLFGAALGQRLGVRLSNRSLRQIYEPESARRVAGLYRSIARDRGPICVKGRFSDHAGLFTSFEGVHVPLLENDGCTILILGGMFLVRPLS